MGATKRAAPRSRISDSIIYVLESLERRSLLSDVSWDAGGNGTSWTDPLNWSTNQLPGAADDVTISSPGDLSIEISSGTRSVHSLVCDEQLTVSGSSTVLVVATTALLSNTLQLESLGTLRGGSWNTVDAGFIRAQFDAQLDGVTVDGSMVIDDTFVRVINGLTVNGNISISETAESALLAFDGSQLLSGTGSITFDGAESLLPIIGPSNFGDVLTIGSTVTIQAGLSAGQLGNVEGGKIVNYGTIAAQSDSNQSLLISQLFTNNGTLSASTGAITLDLDAANFTNYSSGTLTGGTYIVAGSGTIDLGASNVTTNAASITLSDTGAFPALAAMTANAGTITLANARSFSTAGALNHSGTISVDADSSLTSSGLLTWSGGSISGVGLTTAASGVSITGNVMKTGAGVFRVDGALTIGSGKALDVANGTLIVQDTVTSPLGAWSGSSYTGLIGRIQSGRNGGPWNGSGIRTSAASGSVYAVGIASASAVATGGMFAGQSVTGTDTIIRYTLAGDADLDGVIDGDDFFQADNHVGLVGGAVSYFNGDFDFNGRVDADDYWLLDSNYNNSPLASLPVVGAAPAGESELPALTAATPAVDDDALLAELR